MKLGRPQPLLSFLVDRNSSWAVANINRWPWSGPISVGLLGRNGDLRLHQVHYPLGTERGPPDAACLSAWPSPRAPAARPSLVVFCLRRYLPASRAPGVLGSLRGIAAGHVWCGAEPRPGLTRIAVRRHPISLAQDLRTRLPPGGISGANAESPKPPTSSLSLPSPLAHRGPGLSGPCLGR